jgi:hypothetical protein
MTTDTPAPIIKIGNKEIHKTSNVDARISQLLWGKAGCGKTTLAATAPGDKLLINFDDNGAQSLRERDDVFLYDLSADNHQIVTSGKNQDNPFGITEFLKAQPTIKTVIFDSLTTYRDLCLRNGVANLSNPKNGICMEQPSQAGYAYANSSMLQTVRALLKTASRLGLHIIFTAHEGQPIRNDDGVVVEIPLMLSEAIATITPIHISEVWHVRDDGDKRWISIRPCRQRNGMKTRMFITTGKPEFRWDYNADTGTGSTLAAWQAEWERTGKKLPVPNL